MTTATARIEEIRERLKAATPGVFCESDEAVTMHWTNPWSKKKEQLCMVMWPAHPIEATVQVEQWFEAMGTLWESAPSDLQFLLDENARLRAERDEWKKSAQTEMWRENISAEKVEAKLAQTEARERRLRAALEDARDGLSTTAENLANCVEERCVPTVGELNSCKAYLDDVRDALAEPQDVSNNPGVEKKGSCT